MSGAFMWPRVHVHVVHHVNEPARLLHLESWMRLYREPHSVAPCFSCTHRALDLTGQCSAAAMQMHMHRQLALHQSLCRHHQVADTLWGPLPAAPLASKTSQTGPVQPPAAAPKGAPRLGCLRKAQLGVSSAQQRHHQLHLLHKLQTAERQTRAVGETSAGILRIPVLLAALEQRARRACKVVVQRAACD